MMKFDPIFLVPIGISLLIGIIRIIFWYKKKDDRNKVQIELCEMGSDVSTFFAEMKKYKNMSLILGYVSIVLIVVCVVLMFLGIALSGALQFFSEIIMIFGGLLICRYMFFMYHMKTAKGVKKQFDAYKAKGVTLENDQKKFIIIALVISIVASIILTIALNASGGGGSQGPCDACGGDGMFFNEICPQCGGWG